jgi:Ca-activated chloride channel homolog
MNFANFEFDRPEFFYLLILPGIMLISYVFTQHRQNASLQTSSLMMFKSLKGSLKVHLRHLPFVFRLLSIVLLIIALARPQSTSSWEKSKTEGIDIVLSLDISGSMLAEDFKPNRLEAAKDVAIQFITNRPNDRIGLVVYGSESFTQCPLTSDHPVLINLFKDVKQGMIEDGTAIGYGLATAVTRLKESNAKSKVIILLTDGENNAGEISPSTAAELAQAFGIKVYTIGVGTKGLAPMPATDFFGRKVYRQVEVRIDEETLQEIADISGGKYFRATNKEALKNIYEEIDQLEKTELDVKKYSKKHEEYLIFVLFAGLALLLEVLLRLSIYRNLP